MIEHILVPIDGSDHAWKALDIACILAQSAKADLTMVHIATDRPLSEDEQRFASVEFPAELHDSLNFSELARVSGSVESSARLAMKQYSEASEALRGAIGNTLIEEGRARAHEHGLADVKGTVLYGDPAQQILDYAQKHGNDTIIMGSRGLGTLEELWLGSVSHKVSNMARCSCMTVK